ncbi:MAG: HU family DNA-binding protein [Ruminococcaceae bacterium]|nr:HU family DNA-binding protein [Oscillospiraceae bacterium]
MNKAQLIDEIVGKTGIKKKDAEATVVALVETITEAMSKGEKVQIAGLGSFEVKTRPERVGRNPKTQETITIPKSNYPVFSASKSLKDSMNQ